MHYLILAFILTVAAIYYVRGLLNEDKPYFLISPPLNKEKMAYAIAELAQNSKKPSSSGSGLKFRILKKQITLAHLNISEKIRLGEQPHDFEIWIYDNYYKLNEILSRLRARRGIFSSLPHNGNAPRIYDLAVLIVQGCEGLVSKDILEYAVSVYNHECPLHFNEICALKEMISYCLLEYTAALCARSVTIYINKRKGKLDAAEHKVDYAAMHLTSYAYGYVQNCSYEEKIQFEKICNDNGCELEARLDSFYQKIAHYNGMMQNAFSSLRDINVWFTDDFCLQLSILFELFMLNIKDFSLLTTDTKYLYFGEVQKAAKREKSGELSTAKRMIAAANQSTKNAAHFILPPPLSVPKMRMYIVGNVLLCAVLFSIFSFFAGKIGFVFALLSLPILGAVSGYFIKIVLGNAFKSRHLPAYDSKSLSGENMHTTICVPRLIASKEEIEESVQHLQTIMCANRSEMFSYCLLLDLPQSNLPYADEDEELLNSIKQIYQNQLDGKNVCIIVRKRKKVEGKERYQGWEKKRGAVIDLVSYLANGEQDFLLLCGEIKSSAFVITLDSDTLTNSCLRLVELMAHPYNSHKTILSVNMRSNPSLKRESLFSRLFSGGKGLGSYNNYITEIENDMFGCGNFTGKGILRVQSFYDCMKDAFPENCILSHDYVEGALSGCSNSNVYALDTFPQNYSSFLSREIRWLRGDWQLLPYILPKVKNAEGIKVQNKISPIGKWHIFCNIFYSLVPLAVLLLIVSSFFVKMPFIILGVAFLLPAIRVLSGLSGLFIFGFRHAIAELLRQIFWVCALPTLVFNQFIAISVTIIRLIKRKNLLEWKVFAHTKGEISFIPNAIFAVILTATCAVFMLSPVYYVLSLVFVAGMGLNRLLSYVPKLKAKNAEFKAQLTEIAKDTLAYFLDCAQEKNHFLPPDHYQEHREKGFNNSTSPTNIGLYCMALAAGYELGILEKELFFTKVEKLIESLEKLPKWKGNLYNWVDIRTLKPLNGYVSTVDSGNLLASLLFIKTYFNGEVGERIQNLIDETDIGALYDENRELFYIGYNCDLVEYSENHYDLMGSESALSYLVSIGEGKIPQKAWSKLSSQAVKYGASTIYSWTGGMFEYLMSRLFFCYERGTEMDWACKGCVKSQKKYAKQHQMSIWGISESQYYAFDEEENYQYKAFGIPEIAYSNIENNFVFAPYAAILALPYFNDGDGDLLNRFMDLNCYGKYGFYESIDILQDKIMKTFMTHHEGMILCAIANYVCEEVITKRFNQLPQMRAAMLLASTQANLKGKKKQKVKKFIQVAQENVTEIKDKTNFPAVNLLKNNAFKLLTNSVGGNYCLFNNHAVLGNLNRRAGIELTLRCKNEETSLLGGTFAAHAHLSEYTVLNEQWSAVTTLHVLPVADGFVAKVKVRNRSENSLNFHFSSVATPILGSFAAFNAHPAYYKMFIETGREEHFIWARRTMGERFYVAHFTDEEDASILYETSRYNVTPRIKSAHPSFGRVLDPVLYSAFEFSLNAMQEKEFTLFYVCSPSLEKLRSMIRYMRTPHFEKRSTGSVYALSKQQSKTEASKLLAAKLLYDSYGTVQKVVKDLNINLPTVCVEVKSVSGIERLSATLKNIAEVCDFGISLNVVIVFREKQNYYLQLFDMIRLAIKKSNIERFLSADSRIKIFNCMDNESLYQLIIKNSVSLFALKQPTFLLDDVISSKKVYDLAPLKMYEIEQEMGLGGFMADGSYAMDLSQEDTPLAWSNVFSLGGIGSLVTESGGGYTFIGNARERRITVWCNDPIKDVPSEAVILGEAGTVWSITKRPISTKSNYYVCHSFGFSEYRNNFNGICSLQREYILKDEELKVYEIELKNCTQDKRTLDVMLTLNLVLGDFKENTGKSVFIEKVNGHLFKASNAVSGFTVYIHSEQEIDSYATHKESFCDKNGRIVRAGNLTDEGSELNLALSTKVELCAQQTKTILFAFGSESNIAFESLTSKREETYHYFSNLSPVQTQERTLKYLFKWLPYQMLSSRFHGRTGFYQSGGAFGFRDQLQDCLALLYVDAKKVREHILECAKRQFEKGDVLHWWHEPSIGVRTRIMDDRLFLPYVVAEYIEFTKDYEIISERVEYLRDLPLGLGEVSVYAAAQPTDYKASLLEHCIGAIEMSLQTGDNGLVLMQGGDWNDAMDKVGEKGVGTTVWGSMFLYYVIGRFLPYVNDRETKQRWTEARDSLYRAVNASWTGDRFMRAFTDDGRVLGANVSEECKIDLLTQSWAVISNITDSDRKKIALSSAYNHLVDDENAVIKLLTPAFKNMKDIGYISSYPQGVRENGGQYTHAAIWYMIALFNMDKTEDAYKILKLIHPQRHSDTRKQIEKYCVEPYVVSADVYSGDFVGRGGWSWYTGSAAWMYKALLEQLLGIRVSGNKVQFNPKLPAEMDKLNFKYKTSFGLYDITIINTLSDAAWKIKVGEVTYNSDTIFLSPALVGKKITICK